MKSEALLLLKNLLARLDADAGTERPQFLGIVSEGEREALRLLLEDAGSSPPADGADPAAEPVSPPETSPAGAGLPDELNTSVLQHTSSPVPDWTLCLDFGTAKSKAYAATGEEPPKHAPLPLGKADDDDIDGSVHEVSSSIWIDDDGLLFVGSEAVKRSSGYRRSMNRRRLDSLKQELSQVHRDDGPEQLEQPLSREVDPTLTLTHMDAVTVYLAYLTDLATTELESQIGSRYARRRFTLPWWEKGHRQWVGELVTRILGRAQVLADTFHGDWRDGIHVSRLKRCIRDVAVHDDGRLDWMLDTESSGGVLEALAAGSARLWIDHSARRELMLVVDVGAGTTDLSIFWVVQGVVQGENIRRAFPVLPCGGAIRQAGNNLDSLLVDALIRKANLGEDRDMKKRVSAGLWRGSVRRMKETLFKEGKIQETLVSDHQVTLSRGEFLDLKGIKDFESLISSEIQKLFDRVDKTWNNAIVAARHRGITLVLTGGGCGLPMIRNLADKSWTLGGREFKFHTAPDVPDGVADQFSAEVIKEYPKLAVAMGGALPMRLDEKTALEKWQGGESPRGRLETYSTRGN